MMKRDRRAKELKNKLRGKTVSILGDSISTWVGISNDPRANETIAQNEPFYVGTRYVYSPEDTWWGDVIRHTEMQLLVNNSWGGTTVISRQNDNDSSGSGNRSQNLHSNDGRNPDIIFVYMGTNDYANGEKIGVYEGEHQIYDASKKEYVSDCMEFAPAYATMIHKIKSRYSDAEIICFTLLQNEKDFNDSVEVKVGSYNEVIRDVSQKMGVTLIDIEKDLGLRKSFYRAEVTGRRALHPNIGGMERIATSVLNHMVGEYLEKEQKEKS